MTKASLINSYSRGFASKNLKMSIKETENPDETKNPLKKFDDSLKFVKVTHEKSEQNSQSFFMKCMELLPESAIPELIQKIEVFKTKFIAGSGRLSATDEKTFLTSCQKLFDKHGAIELMDYLVKIKPMDLRPTMLSSTIFGFDSEIDIKNKIDKFHSFSSTNSPDSLYSSDEAERELDGSHAFHKEQTDTDLLSKISKMSLKRAAEPSHNHKPSKSYELEGLEDIEGVEIVNDFAGLEGLPGLSGLGDAQPIMIDIEGAENEGEDFLDFMPNKGMASQAELDVKQAIDAASADLFTDNNRSSKRKDYLRHKFTMNQENIMQYQTQGKEEVVYVTQKGFEKKQIQKTNWVYLYGLPYEIADENEMKNKIAQHLLPSVGKIKNIKLYSFKNYLDLSEKEKKVAMYPNLDAIFDPINAFSEKLGFESIDYEGESFQTLPLNTEEGSSNGLITNKKEREKIDFRLRVTKKILASLKAKANLRLDKSYALIELENEEAKKKALVPDLRIFGMHIDGRMCMVDDADHKLTINCYNVHWGSTLKSFTTYINKIFEDNNLLDLRVEIPPQFENKILTKFYVLLRFNSFYNTIRAMQVLENTIFEKRPLKAHHLYGSLKLIRNEYSESIDMDTISTKTGKVNDTKLREVHRISFISKDEDLFNDISDPLGKIEKDIQAYGVESQAFEQETLEDEVHRIRKIQEVPEEKWYQSTTSDSDDEGQKYETETINASFHSKGYKA